MSEKILVPVLGESITEATVSKWLKKQGDSVIADEAIVELETDKVNPIMVIYINCWSKACPFPQELTMQRKEATRRVDLGRALT